MKSETPSDESRRGWILEHKEGKLVYKDNGEPLGPQVGLFDRPCSFCGEKPTEEGHDAVVDME